jgi:3-hydroxyanthranilate 3,4-dioxygenase
MLPAQPFNLLRWIDENRDLLKPPVGNQTIYHGNKDFIVMVVGGPNARKDYHINQGEELFYQLEGTVTVGLQAEDGSFSEVKLGPGDMMLMPPNKPHRPIRPAGTIGLVLEKYRDNNEEDGFVWFCENCQAELYRTYIPVGDIVKDLPLVMNAFFGDTKLCTCKHCGSVMEKPKSS